jgi:drug/metabolite transporter (DMT)-like permease
MPSLGALMCFASAAAFGANAIFAKLAYDKGATVGTLLASRFILAAALFWLLMAVSGQVRSLRAISRRDAGTMLALGALGYSTQSGSYFTALRHLDASLVALLLYTFPAIVTVAAILLGRDRASRRTFAALALASVGLILILGGARSGALDPLGVALALTAAVVYSCYVLVSDGVAGRVDPLTLSTLVCTGAAVTLTLGGVAAGDFSPGQMSAEAWGWVAAIAVLSTVGAIVLFFAGLRRVGPTAASILSTVEPVVTVVLAYEVFGESLGVVPLIGGALVLLAVVAVRTPARAPAPVTT